MAFFSKTNIMITIFAKTSSSLSKKRHFFAKFFGENIFKNHNIGPRLDENSPMGRILFAVGCIFIPKSPK
jgi:hypothetical protein